MLAFPTELLNLQELIFGASLPASLPPTSDPDALEALVLPHSRFRHSRYYRKQHSTAAAAAAAHSSSSEFSDCESSSSHGWIGYR
jgi:hypothetical protein